MTLADALLARAQAEIVARNARLGTKEKPGALPNINAANTGGQQSQDQAAGLDGQILAFLRTSRDGYLMREVADHFGLGKSTIGSALLRLCAKNLARHVTVTFGQTRKYRYSAAEGHLQREVEVLAPSAYPDQTDAVAGGNPWALKEGDLITWDDAVRPKGHKVSRVTGVSLAPWPKQEAAE